MVANRWHRHGVRDWVRVSGPETRSGELPQLISYGWLAVVELNMFGCRAV